MIRTFGKRSGVPSVAPEPVAEEPDESVPDLDADTLLRRIRRVPPAVDTVEAETTRALGVAAAELGRNAFPRLRVATDADDAAISRAYDDLSFEPDADEAALGAARAQLTSARGRLIEEFGWLPEAANVLQAEARGALANGDRETLTRLRNAAGGLARINLSLALADKNDLDDWLGLFIDIRNWNPAATLDAIDEARGRARVRAVDETHFEALVAERLDAWAVRLMPAFTGSKDGRARLVHLMLHLPDEPGNRRALWLDAVLRAYTAGVEDVLATTLARLRTQLDRLAANPADGAAATGLLTSLDLWTTYRAPIQVVEAARGLDDPASAGLLLDVRAASIRLSDAGQHATSLRFNQALILFANHVPVMRAKIEADLSVAESNALFAQVTACCEHALLEPRKFAQNVLQGGLEGKTHGPANALCAAFARALELWSGDPSALFGVVRNMSVKLHNEAGQTAATPILIKWLLAWTPPIEVAAKLREDLRTATGTPSPKAAGRGKGLGALAVASMILGVS